MLEPTTSTGAAKLRADPHGSKDMKQTGWKQNAVNCSVCEIKAVLCREPSAKPVSLWPCSSVSGGSCLPRPKGSNGDAGLEGSLLLFYEILSFFFCFLLLHQAKVVMKQLWPSE